MYLPRLSAVALASNIKKHNSFILRISISNNIIKSIASFISAITTFLPINDFYYLNKAVIELM